MGPKAEERCPSVVQVLERADGGLARVRVPGGRLTAGRLRALADAARRHGNGTIELTNRANVQVRGIRPGHADALAGELMAAGLSRGGPGDLRRNVLSGLAGLDPTALADLSALVDHVVEALDSASVLDDLSPKWGVTLDGGGRWSLAGRRDDVVVTACDDGRCTTRSLLGAVTTDPDGVPQAVRAAAVASLHHPRHLSAVPGAAVQAGPLGPGPGWVAAMPPLGRLDPDAADAVADLAPATGEVRLTPWRSIVVRGADAGGLAAAGLLTDPADPATAVVACAGAAGCTAGLTDAPADALAVARSRTTPMAVHVSGCAKRCAHPAPAARTLVAVAPGRYDVLGPDDRPLASGVRVADAVAMVS